MRLIYIVSVLLVTGCVAVPKENIDREEIRQTISSNRSKFKLCYDEALKRNENLSGRIVVEFDIETQGDVPRAFAIENDTQDTVFGSCIADQLKTIKFPPPPKEEIARVRYPFVFSSQKR